ncbi:hypothetical protein ABMA27_004060 [Loxostege sticticalis]|uniref:tRNA (32-2'-O)-methyltransferase regulator THADA n=1 Tax=Loxostege sticticalis TaxID=481309 RepID=A0ABR3HRA4_LOXSC
MNGLSLRINPTNRKNKNSIGFAPVVLPKYANTGTKNELVEEFLKSNTSEKQLALMKNILNTSRDSLDDDIIRFLALVFLQAETKHPVKCFLTRHITKTESLEQPFADKLALEIKHLITNDCTEYTQYVDVVLKVASCIENFPAGSLAIKAVEVELASYLTHCLQCCVSKLSNTKLSPTEKNEVYNLTHLALRLLLYIVQKLSDHNVGNLVLMFSTIREYIKYLFYDEDSPMDTKSICGILFLSMQMIEDGLDSWTNILEPSTTDDRINALLQNEAAQLSLYSAIATVVSVDRLQTQLGNEYAIMSLLQKIIAIGWRSSSESTFILGVARTVVQISKMLDKVVEPAIGLSLVESILSFVWGHLEHYMDSVRHLTAQALANVVRYCTRLEKLGDTSALDRLFTALGSLDTTRKSYYVSLTSLAAQLGATRLMQRLPDIIRDVISALGTQAVQASATTALEMLLQKHALESNTETLYETWVVPIMHHVETNAPDSALLNILENLMAKAVALDENIINYIVSHIKESSDPDSSPGNLKCILLLLSAARKAGLAARLTNQHSSQDWKGVISYELLERAAVDSIEETRILSLSLVVESPKTTEQFTEGDFDFVLYYLRYNINAQSPNFRQLTLSLMKKFIKRVEESYKALSRSKAADGSHYLSFVDRFREFCFASLMPGANYSRRFVALQLLAWVDCTDLNGYSRVWKEDYIEKLLLHLEDSYENNKSLALQILDKCPSDLVKGKKYRISLDLDSILQQASSMKPTDCVSAAYKLNFVRRKLPEYILEGNTSISEAEPVLFALLSRLLHSLTCQLSVCSQGVVLAARHAPMYGLVHCIGHLVGELDAGAISEDNDWKMLIEQIIQTCVLVNKSVACVVNNSSPEGHLPMDAGGIAADDYGNSGDVRLEDGRPVTAQMVLLCAWRSVKEVSLLLGTISSRLSIEGEGGECGTLSRQQMVLIGEHFTSLLAETKHRGAFEQAYVGFTRLLARLWRCRSESLHGLPRAWLQALTRAVAEPHPARSATRRSAGLPFMIQALVTTELQVQGNPKCLHECMTTLLRLARSTTTNTDQNTQQSGPFDSNRKRQDIKTDSQTIDTNKFESLTLNDSQTTIDTEHSENHIESLPKDNLVEARTHSLNILRALFRNSALEESVAGYVGEGLMVALTGFEGDTWMERNSSTLLFSALMVRIFGVARDRHSDSPALRNTMTGRIFFLRYPQLYDFILNKLTEAVSSADSHLHPSLYPVLVLLGRLYPSMLEGTVSTLRLGALLPLALGAARSRVLATRQLAARAVPPLIAIDQYFKHIESMLILISDRTIKRNYCHGILLQITRLLDKSRPELASSECYQDIIDKIEPTLWILEQASGERPCYIIADEYTKMINLIFMKVWRFPSFISDDLYFSIIDRLHNILFTENIPSVTSGRNVCLANVFNLYLVIHYISSDISDICEFILKGLDHKSYEVVLCSLNYLLILNKSLDIDNCKFQEHLSSDPKFNELILSKLRKSPDYVQKLCKILENIRYQECLQKALKVLTLESDTQKQIIGIKMGMTADVSDEEVVRKLFDCIQNEHESLTHIYLESLSNFVTKKLEESSISIATVLDVIRLIFACSSSDNSDGARNVVAAFLEKNFGTLMKMDLGDLSDEEKFEFKSLLFGTTVTILEDDDERIRQRTSDVIAVTSHHPHPRVVPARAAELLGGMVGEAALFVLLALLDFKSEVCMTDEISDECRVFDQNERYNIFLEECVWTIACADKILEITIYY